MEVGNSSGGEGEGRTPCWQVQRECPQAVQTGAGSASGGEEEVDWGVGGRELDHASVCQ